jgi:hypothetical protein
MLTYLWKCSSRETMSIRITSVKLLSSLNHFVPYYCSWRAIAKVLVAGLRRDQIRREAEVVVYDLCIPGFQRCHYGSWSKVNFFLGHSVLSKAGFQQHYQLQKVISPKPLIRRGQVNTRWKAKKVSYLFHI